MKATLLVPVCALAALLCSGCQHNYQFDVHSTNSMALGAPPASYRLKVVSAPESEDSPRSRAAAERLKNALFTKGLIEAPKNAAADLLVTVDYSIGPRQVRHETHRDLVPPVRDSAGNLSDNTAQLAYTTEEVVTYQKYLAVTAYDNRPVLSGAKVQALWRVEASINDDGADLAKYVSLLARAGAGYIGTNASEKKEILTVGGI